ncbi:MAG: Mov34/MPN/PAD-1 family protein [Candidatus Electrothrix communis]|nr:MAG: Mov34/MPN/PAD-1 family protein [Candidatus Electrothrix communis]
MMSKQKKFVIEKDTAAFCPDEKALEPYSIDQKLNSNFSETKEENAHRFYLTKNAQDQIFNFIDWGRSSARNQMEQGGILIGHAFKDSVQGITYCIAKKAIEGKDAQGSAAYLRIEHRAWKAMIDEADELLDSTPDNNMQIIGWFHTHPNGLPVFMSGTDQMTQKRMFAQDWHFAIVLNPQKQIWRAYYGASAEECKGFMLDKDV